MNKRILSALLLLTIFLVQFTPLVLAETTNDTKGYASMMLNDIDELINEENFTNETGYQAWLDYQELAEDLEFADMLELASPNQGTTLEEVDEFFQDKNVARVENDLGKGEMQVYYRYEDPEGRTFNDEFTVFYGEILTHFVDERLVFTSVQPGFFDIAFDRALPIDLLSTGTTIEEYSLMIKKPYVMSVSQLNYDDFILTTFGIFSIYKDQNSGTEINTMYYPVFATDTLSDNQGNIANGYVPFQEASQDLGNMAFKVLKSHIRSLSEEGTENP